MSERERILVVEDDPSIRQLIHDCLVREGHTVELAADGASANDKLNETSYRVVISDVKLPGMDGLKLLSRHGGSGSFTRFLMVSGTSTIGDADVTVVWNGATKRPRTRSFSPRAGRRPTTTPFAASSPPRAGAGRTS